MPTDDLRDVLAAQFCDYQPRGCNGLCGCGNTADEALAAIKANAPAVLEFLGLEEVSAYDDQTLWAFVEDDGEMQWSRSGVEVRVFVMHGVTEQSGQATEEEL